MIKIKIRDWDMHFERDRTKQWKTLQWVPIPNKQGSGYRIIMSDPRGLEIFACWNALVQVASKCNPRGDLTKYDMRKLSLLTMISEKKLVMAIEFLSSELDWVEIVNLDTNVNNLDLTVKNLDTNGNPNSECCSVLFNSIQSNSIHKEGKGNKEKAEQIYQAYPRKVGKKVAVEKILKLLKVMDYETLLSKTTQYAESVKTKEMQYIPHASTWFNQERFNDPIEQQAPKQGGRALNEYERDAGSKYDGL